MVRLAQRIQSNKALGAWDCRGVFLLLFEEYGEAVQHLRDSPPVVVAQWRDPVVIESKQKVVFIKLRRSCKGLNLPAAILRLSRGGGLRNRGLKVDGVH